MKNFLKNLKYTSLVIVVIIGVFTNIKQVQATWNYSTIYSIPYNIVATNLPPVANAGIDRSITLPINSVTIPLGGATATDPDGTITSMVWTKVSGPATFSIANGSSLTPIFSGLVQGSYKFSLTVTDNNGLTGQDDMIITVGSAIPTNLPPEADAGPSQTINSPASGVSLSGSGTDPDGFIVGYKWVSDTGQGNIISPNSAATSVTGLSVGTYSFTLTVTDNGGLTGSDYVKIIVLNSDNPTVKAYIQASPTNMLDFPGGTIQLKWWSEDATWCKSFDDNNSTNPPTVWYNTGGDPQGLTPQIDLTSSTTFGVHCEDANGNFADAKTTVTVGPQDGEDPKEITVTLTPQPTNVPYGGGQAKFTWNSTNATFCNDIKTINTAPISNTIPTNGETQGTTDQFDVGIQITYEITCKANGLQPVTAYATIGILPKGGDDDPCDGGICPPGDEKKQCSDGKDNVDSEDTLIDDKDPGCYTNGVYNPNDDDEKNVIKIKEIEI